MQIMSPNPNPVINEARRIAAATAGALLYSAGGNLFIVPAGLYNGGLMGLCQIIRTVLVEYLNVRFSFDVAGILYFILNIPILIMSWMILEKRFVIRSVINVAFTTLFMSLIPVYELISGDILTSCLVGGFISGFGAGLTLWSATAGGGTDLIGFMLIKKKGQFSIGGVNLSVDVVLYALCFFMFSPQTAIYSIVYAVIYSFVMDRVHQQNINVEAIAICSAPADELKEDLLGTLGRGITELPARGAYTGDEKVSLLVVLSKYEVSEFTSIVHKHDPKAFITFNEHVKVFGNFERKL